MIRREVVDARSRSQQSQAGRAPPFRRTYLAFCLRARLTSLQWGSAGVLLWGLGFGVEKIPTFGGEEP
jgi:hypothetical protein